MKIDEIRKAIRHKLIEYEVALSFKRPYAEIKKIYLELKELQYKIVQKENELHKT